MIVITGATGQLGRAVLEHLLTRVEPATVAVSVRDPQRVPELAARGVRVRRGDYADPASLATAFAGASTVLLVSSGTWGEQALRLHRTAIDAAVAAGAERVLYTSHMGAHPDSLFAPMPDHAATEQLLRAAGVTYTALRNGYYIDSALQMLGTAAATGVLALPADGPVSWTAHADLAEAAVLALTGAVDLGPTSPPLTGSQALDMAAVAEIAAERAGRPIERVVVSDAQYRERRLAEGVPAPVVELMLGTFAASRNGEFAAVDPTLQRLLGRPPLTVRDVLAAGA